MHDVNIEKREFYTLSQACKYLNNKHNIDSFNENNILHKFYEYKLPVNFYLDECEILLDCSIDIINIEDEQERQDKEKMLGIQIMELLELVSLNTGLFYQLETSDIQKTLLNGFTTKTGEYNNAFCWFANPDIINTGDNNFQWLKDELIKGGLDYDFEMSDIKIYPSFTSYNDDLLDFHKKSIKSEYPNINIIDFDEQFSWRNEDDDDNLVELKPVLKIGFDDLILFHSDLHKLETLIFLNALNAGNNEELHPATATPANYALSAENSSYTTPFIDVLNAVIQEFWINYQEHNIPPKQDIVIRWIMEHYNLSRAGAKAIEQVARPAKAKTGGIKSLP